MDVVTVCFLVGRPLVKLSQVQATILRCFRSKFLFTLPQVFHLCIRRIPWEFSCLAFVSLVFCLHCFYAFPFVWYCPQVDSSSFPSVFPLFFCCSLPFFHSLFKLSQFLLNFRSPRLGFDGISGSTTPRLHSFTALLFAKWITSSDTLLRDLLRVGLNPGQKQEHGLQQGQRRNGIFRPRKPI